MDAMKTTLLAGRVTLMDKITFARLKGRVCVLLPLVTIVIQECTMMDAEVSFTVEGLTFLLALLAIAHLLEILNVVNTTMGVAK